MSVVISFTAFFFFILTGFSTEISLEVAVDKTLAYRFNCGHEKIEDILVMHLHGGKDFFISFNYTCFHHIVLEYDMLDINQLNFIGLNKII